MMFSGKTLFAVATMALSPDLAQAQNIIGADCWFDGECTNTPSNVLERNQGGVTGAGCLLPPTSEYPLTAGQYPDAYYMGDGPGFCGNRKSGIMTDDAAALLEAVQFCFDIGASSVCKWGDCPHDRADAPCFSTPPSVWGDPHFRTWTGEGYDFHGICDLVFLESPSHNLTVHVRTTQRYHYSFVSSAAVSLNGQVMEFSSYGVVSQDGVFEADDTQLPATFGGAALHLMASSKKTHTYMIELADGSGLEVKSYKDMVGVKVIGDRKVWADSRGVMGSAKTGEKLGRDGVTIIEDNNMFGMEWQVSADEAMLFETTREPQAPQSCFIPEVAIEGRRLGESMARAEAEEACANWHMNKEACISDVMTTGDKDLAANVY